MTKKSHIGGAASWTVRTIAALTEAGWLAEKTEHWNPFSRTRHDLFGFLDVVAVKPGQGTLGVQVCSHSDGSTRMKKILASPATGILLAAGWQIQVWGWVKRNNVWEFVPRDVEAEVAKR